jgi:chromosome segregation ATPase
VIQSILFFALGFLCAGFLALMVAPAVWRRAVRLTRKRIEASVPLTLNEIQADKDRIRAEFAMSTRRLEMSIKSFREKAAAQLIEIDRNREELKRLSSERADKDRALSQLEAKSGELRAELRIREDQMQRMADRLAEAEKRLEEKAHDLDRLGRMYDDAAFNASNRQIELVARESEVEKLAVDVSSLRKDGQKRLNEISAENKTLREALKADKKRIGELEKRNERLTATLADRDEKLDRRERELARLREHMSGASRAGNDLESQLGEAQIEKARLEAQVADLTLQISRLLSGATGGDVDKAVAKLDEDRARLEERLAVLTRENKKLRTDLASYERAKSEDWSEERRENALLREQINDLAAEVITMTAALEGPESPIRTALAAAPERPADPRDGITSLADRVKALQKAASAT